MPKKYEFDHTNNKFHDAIGLSKEEMMELLVQAKKIFKNIDKEKKSVVVEDILNVISDLNQKEVSVVIFLLLDYIRHKVSGALLDSIVKMIETGMPPPSFPKLPDSDDKFNPSYM